MNKPEGNKIEKRLKEIEQEILVTDNIVAGLKAQLSDNKALKQQLLGAYNELKKLSNDWELTNKNQGPTK
jgi:hypothetical protein